MKIKKLKLLTILLVLSISIVSILTLKTFSKKDSTKPFGQSIALVDIDSKEFQDATEKALEEKYGSNYKEIVKKNVEAADMASKIDMKYLNSSTKEIKYPSAFGGKYIDDSNNLVVQVVKESSVKKVTKLKQDIINIDDNIIFEYVNNSYSDLENVNNQIINYFTENGVLNNNFAANYIDVIKNVVIVELKNNTKEEQEWFRKNVVDSALIEFVENQNQVVSTSTYNAGGNFGGFCSIAYRAKLSGKEGFITAGHCVSDNETISGYGTVKKRQYGGNLDAAFVQLSSGNSVTNKIEYPTYPSMNINTTSNAYPDLNTVGTIIAKSGITMKATSGKILNANFSCNSDGTYLTNQVNAEALCDFGDSGGLIYKLGTNSRPDGTVVGVTHGKVLVNGYDNPGPVIYTKSSLIQSTFGITRY